MRRSVETYAILAREFSDSVARLGSCSESDPNFMRVIQESKERLNACIDAAGKLEQRWNEKAKAKSNPLRGIPEGGMARRAVAS